MGGEQREDLRMHRPACGNHGFGLMDADDSTAVAVDAGVAGVFGGRKCKRLDLACLSGASPAWGRQNHYRQNHCRSRVVLDRIIMDRMIIFQTQAGERLAISFIGGSTFGVRRSRRGCS